MRYKIDKYENIMIANTYGNRIVLIDYSSDVIERPSLYEALDYNEELGGAEDFNIVEKGVYKCSIEVTYYESFNGETTDYDMEFRLVDIEKSTITA